MKIPSFPFFRRTKSGAPSASLHLDKKLLQHIDRRQLPGWSQIKYVGQFMSVTEKKTVTLLAAIAAITAGIWLSVFVLSHYTLAPAEGGEYTEAVVGQPKYLNPLFASSNDIDTDIASMVYAGLMRYDESGRLTTDLAASIATSSDEKIFEVILRPNLTWSDGEPLTANDVLYTIETIQNIETNSPLLPAWQGIKVEKTNDLSIRFTLKEAFAPFPHSLTLGILPEHVWASIAPSGLRLAKNNLQPIGAGPWKFSKLVKDESGRVQSYSLVQNEKYYGQKPFLKTISFKFFENYEALLAEAQNNKISGASFLPQSVADKLSPKYWNFYRLQLPHYVALFFNESTQPMLKEQPFRQALALGTNKAVLIEKALKGRGVPLDAPIPPGILGYHAEVKKNPFNPEEALKLLDATWPRIPPETYFELRKKELLKNYRAEIEAAEAATSTPELVSSTLDRIDTEITATVRSEMAGGQLFYRTDKNRELINITITTIDTDEYQAAAEIVAEAWRALGITVTVERFPSRQIIRDVLRNRRYQVLLYGEVLGADPDLFPFWHSSQVDYPGLNLAQFSDRGSDKLLEQARATGNEAERTKFYHTFQDTLAKELPSIFLYTPLHTIALTKKIKGADFTRPIPAPAERFKQLGNWYIKTKRVWHN